jgi:hypothetical protein
MMDLLGHEPTREYPMDGDEPLVLQYSNTGWLTLLQ